MPTDSAEFPRLSVAYAPPGAPAATLVCRPGYSDAARYEIARDRAGWPALDDAPLFAMAFMAWSAIKRDPAAPGVLKTPTVDAFLDVIQNVSPALDDRGEAVTSRVDPTLPGPPPGF
ncbi:hypothetical protein [Leifsonia xyli]|nr:hypothetical protein [Leifsonia xyli]